MIEAAITIPEVDDAGEGNAPDLRDYVRTIWRYGWLIVATVAIAVGATLAFSFTETPVYEASADLLIQPNEIQQLLNPTTQSGQDPAAAARNVATEVAVLQSRIVQDAAKHQLGHNPDVSISSNSGTSDVVGVNARSTNAGVAAADANGYANVYVALRQNQTKADLLQAAGQIQAKISQIDFGLPGLPVGSPAFTTTESQRATLQQELNQLQVAANLNQVGARGCSHLPTCPPAPSRPRSCATRRSPSCSACCSVSGSCSCATTSTTRSGRAKTSNASPGAFPYSGRSRACQNGVIANAAYLVSIDAPGSAEAEAYRTLRTSVQFLAVDRKFGSIQVTSSEPDEGKTTVLANLAVAFARAGRSVTIVCCDLRRPRIHEFFGLANDIGFTSLLLGEVSLVDAFQRVRGEANLAVLSAGRPPPNPAELLSSGRAREVVTSIERSVDLMIVDSPPVLPVSDALIISGMVDATLIVASEKSSSRRALHRTIEILRQVDAPLVGTVLNNSSTNKTYGYGYEYVESVRSGPKGTRSSRRQRREASRAGR